MIRRKTKTITMCGYLVFLKIKIRKHGKSSFRKGEILGGNKLNFFFIDVRVIIANFENIKEKEVLTLLFQIIIIIY